jgi:hypothetical protein
VNPEKGKYNNRKINMTCDSDSGIDDVDPGKGKYNNRKINISSDSDSGIDYVDPEKLDQGKVNITIGKLI